MKNKSRLFRVVGAAALLISMLAATVVPAVAQEDGEVVDADVGRSLAPLFSIEDPGFLGGTNTIFYPWVANDDDFGLGPADTSISVQNLEEIPTQIFIYVGNGNGGYDLATSAFLAPWAAKSFHAAQLGIAEGEGSPVAVASFTTFAVPGTPDPDFPGTGVGDWLIETPVILSNPVADTEAGGEFTQVAACVVNLHAGGNLLFGSPYPFRAAVDFTFDGVDYEIGDWVDWDTQADLQAILDAVNEGNTGPMINPFGGLNMDGDCFDAIGPLGTPGVTGLDSVAIGGVAKQAVEGEALPSTSGVDTAVSGYNAINGWEIAYFDEWYLPIVQTNCGPGGCWDSMIRVGSMFGQNSAVEIRFFPADDGSGSLATGFQIQGLVQGGDTWNVNLGDYVPDGWVGSAHIYSDGNAFAMVDRYKVGYNMWITNTGSSAGFENAAQFENAQGRYVLFAPHVLLDYFGWNTGINVANLAGTDNNISVQYFNTLGNATEVLTQRLAAHGMTYFYDPSVPPQNIGQDPTFGEPVMSDPNANIVGSALIWSDEPVAVAVDATKYPETDPTGAPDIFQAISYSATQNVYNWQAVPLVQKGSPTTGMGDTSGINIMNPHPQAVTANVYYTNPSGFNAQNFGVSSVTIPGFANGFVYTMTQRNLPNGFTGSAVVVANAPVVAASANVNYEVQFDGAAIFNAFNPCGFYRTVDPWGECFFGDPFDITGRSVTKTFVDTNGDPVAGVNFTIVGTTEFFPYQRDGISGPDGSRIFTNVPVGDYELFVDSVPDGYVAPDPTVAQDTFTVTQGADVVLENVLEIETEGFTKTVVVAEVNGEDDGLTDITLEGVNVIVYAQIGTEAGGDPVLGAVVFEGVTGADGTVSGNLAAGDYVLCIWDEDGLAVTSEGDVVSVLGLSADAAGACIEGYDLFTVGDDVADDLVNGVFVESTVGGINVITTGQEGTTPVSGIDVALFALAEGDDCGDVTPGVDVPDFTGTTTIDGEFSFAGLAPGEYCIFADFDDNGFDAGDVFGEVTVVAGVTGTIQLDIDLGVIILGNIVVEATGTGVNEVQTLSTTGGGGTMTLTFDGETTGAIVLTGGTAAVAANIEAALEALTNIGVGNVVVTDVGGGDFDVEFVGTLAGTDVPTLIIDDAAATGDWSIVVTTEGVAGLNVQTISADVGVTGGTFTLTYETETTAAIAWNADAATVEAALEALAGIVDVTVAGGPLPGAAIVVTFVDPAAPVSLLVVDASLIV